MTAMTTCPALAFHQQDAAITRLSLNDRPAEDGPGDLEARALTRSLERRGRGLRYGFLTTSASSLVASVLSAQVLAPTAPVLLDNPLCYNVRSFGARGDDTGNDASAIQLAINQARADGGGQVCFPAGVYRLTSGIVVPDAVTLIGVGWQPVTGYFTGKPGGGSWIHVTNMNFVPVTITGIGSGLRDLAFRHDQPDPAASWAPLQYPFTIDIVTTPGKGHGDVLLRDVFMLNPTRGVRQRDPGNGDSSGRLVIDRLWGQPLEIGVSIEFMSDVMRVNNVHFWQFWSTHAGVDSYTKANATGVISYRNDNPHFSNIFFLGYRRGIEFARGARGVTNKFRISNMDCDICATGVFVSGSGTTGQIVNMTAQGTGIRPSEGLFVAADDVQLQVCNLRVSDTSNNGIRVQGSNSRIALENVHIENWNQSAQGFPAIEAASAGATVYLGFGRWFSGGGSAAQWGGPGMILGGTHARL